MKYKHRTKCNKTTDGVHVYHTSIFEPEMDCYACGKLIGDKEATEAIRHTPNNYFNNTVVPMLMCIVAFLILGGLLILF